MPHKTFQIPTRSSDWAETELNDFLRSHRVLIVDRQSLDRGANSFWAVLVDDLDSAAESPQKGIVSASKKKVDYKEMPSVTIDIDIDKRKWFLSADVVHGIQSGMMMRNQVRSLPCKQLR